MAWCKRQAARARKLARLAWRDMLLLTEAWLTLVWVDLVISFTPYRRWRHWLQLQAPELAQRDVANACAVNESMQRRAEHIIRLSEVAARNHLRTMNCLRRTLAQQRLLSRRHVATRVHIGVRKSESTLEAHAWLSAQSSVLNDTADVGNRYAELQADQWGRISRFID